jgi:hypothetical protein
MKPSFAAQRRLSLNKPCILHEATKSSIAHFSGDDDKQNGYNEIESTILLENKGQAEEVLNLLACREELWQEVTSDWIVIKDIYVKIDKRHIRVRKCNETDEVEVLHKNTKYKSMLVQENTRRGVFKSSIEVPTYNNHNSDVIITKPTATKIQFRKTFKRMINNIQTNYCVCMCYYGKSMKETEQKVCNKEPPEFSLEIEIENKNERSLEAQKRIDDVYHQSVIVMNASIEILNFLHSDKSITFTTMMSQNKRRKRPDHDVIENRDEQIAELRKELATPMEKKTSSVSTKSRGSLIIRTSFQKDFPPAPVLLNNTIVSREVSCNDRDCTDNRFPNWKTIWSNPFFISMLSFLVVFILLTVGRPSFVLNTTTDDKTKEKTVLTGFKQYNFKVILLISAIVCVVVSITPFVVKKCI